MSITRSSIPVCINCSAPCASRRVPPLCVTAAHSSPVPPAIVRDVARPVPERVPLLRATVSPAGPPGGRSLGRPALGHPCTQLLEKPLSTPFPLPTYFFPILFSFSILCFPLFLLCLTHPFPSHPNFCSLRMRFSIKLLSQCCCISRWWIKPPARMPRRP